MSDRTENRKTNREPTDAPGARQQPAEEYTGYNEVDPDRAGEQDPEAVREAGLQPGTPESEGEKAVKREHPGEERRPGKRRRPDAD